MADGLARRRLAYRPASDDRTTATLFSASLMSERASGYPGRAMELLGGILGQAKVFRLQAVACFVWPSFLQMRHGYTWLTQTDRLLGRDGTWQRRVPSQALPSAWSRGQ